MDLKGKTALVTGASSGIGDQLARKLAARGADLILVARRQERLETLARELAPMHGVKIRSIGMDLAAPDAGERLHAGTEGQGQRVDVLLNNAGFGTHGYFLDIPWDVSAQQLQLNVMTLTDLTWRFARSMRERRQGWVLNVSSIGAYTPAPTYATYAAGKAYVRSFTEALAHELRGSGVHATCVCPGGTLTGFHDVAGQERPGLGMMSAERCAELALSALFAGRRNVVTGFLNKAMTFFMGLLPNSVIIPAAALSMGEPRAQLPGADEKAR